jgi:hypothetical protein
MLVSQVNDSCFITQLCPNAPYMHMYSQMDVDQSSLNMHA